MLTSGERYLVCLNFRNEYDGLINILLDYLKKFDQKETIIDMDKISNKFIDSLNEANNIMGYRRITSINQSIFQVNNFKYINEHPDLYKYNKKMVDYYVTYFVQYYKLEKIKDADRILDYKSRHKWQVK